MIYKYIFTYIYIYIYYIYYIYIIYIYIYRFVISFHSNFPPKQKPIKRYEKNISLLVSI